MRTDVAFVGSGVGDASVSTLSTRLFPANVGSLNVFLWFIRLSGAPSPATLFSRAAFPAPPTFTVQFAQEEVQTESDCAMQKCGLTCTVLTRCQIQTKMGRFEPQKLTVRARRSSSVRL